MVAVIIILGVVLLLGIYMVFISLYTGNFKRKKLLYNIDNDKNIRITKDIEYKKVGGRSLLMDIYQPEDAVQTGKLPVVILIHGDGAESFIKDAKDWGIYTSYGRLLAQNGLACIVFNHRSAGMTSGFKKVNEPSEDVLDLVDYIRKNAGNWNIDESRICIWAFSAGAVYLSLFFKNMPQYIRSIVSYYGLLDVKAWTKKNQELLKPFYPENYLLPDTLKEVPIMLVRAAKDTRRIHAGTDNFINSARSNGIGFESIVHPNGKHAFDIVNDDDETRRIIKRTLEFIKGNMW